MFTEYEETIRFLYEALPMFQRIGAAALKLDLSNTEKLCATLGNPQEKFKTIHVAGTNGKGSTAHMLASVLQAAGYKTGLYTSPHLKDFSERIRIDGREVSNDFIVDFVNRIYPLIAEIKPSFFELTVAMAFDYFAAQQVDVAVIEVGMGGRLDSTNVITPVLSVITNIGWDHKELLGDTLPKIAGEKAGIIKTNVPIVISERQAEVEDVFMERSEQQQSPIIFASDNYTVIPLSHTNGIRVDVVDKLGTPIYASLTCDLAGKYQYKNVLGVIASINILQKAGWDITETALRTGLSQVSSATGLKGRWQLLGTHPLCVCDTAHNADGIRLVVEQINAQSYQNLHAVIGMVGDKDVSAILSLLPIAARYYFCQAKLPRAMEASTLAEMASRVGLSGEVVPDVKEAIIRAMHNASPDDMVFIGGSTFVVAEIDNL